MSSALPAAGRLFYRVKGIKVFVPQKDVFPLLPGWSGTGWVHQISAAAIKLLRRKELSPVRNATSLAGVMYIRVYTCIESPNLSLSAREYAKRGVQAGLLFLL
jgi:hypothetical protein